MIRTLTAAAALSLLAASSVLAAASDTAPAAKSSSTKSSKSHKAAAAPVTDASEQPNDTLSPGELTMADRVLTGVADCEMKEKVDVEKLPGHNGNFTITYDRKRYIVSPRETTTGAIVLADAHGEIKWVQIPRKSMLMNEKLHQRLVDECQEDEQRIASRAAGEAAATAPALAPSVAGPGPGPAAIAAEKAVGASPAAAAVPVPTSASVSVVPSAPVVRAAQAPDAAASGMFR